MVMLPLLAFKVRELLSSTRFRLIVWLLVLLLTTSPIRLTVLPLRTNAPAEFVKRIPLNRMLLAKLLVLFKPIAPAKIKRAFDCTAVPPQLAAFVQLASEPAPPVHSAGPAPMVTKIVLPVWPNPYESPLTGLRMVNALVPRP